MQSRQAGRQSGWGARIAVIGRVGTGLRTGVSLLCTIGWVTVVSPCEARQKMQCSPVQFSSVRSLQLFGLWRKV